MSLHIVERSAGRVERSATAASPTLHTLRFTLHENTLHAITRRVLRGLCLLAVLGAMLCAEEAAAQRTAPSDTTRTREVIVEYADALSGGVEDGERVQRLQGSVRLRQEHTQLWARRVVRYLDRDEILFVGDVQIVDEGDSLHAEQVVYDTRSKVGRATGSVRLSDGEVEVFAPSGLYFIDEKRAQFEEGVTLIDSLSVLRSRGGVYWTEEKRAEFYEEVHLVQDRTTMEADSVTFFRETEVSLARGNVFIERVGDDDEEEAAAPDTTTRTLLFGRQAYHDNRQDYSRIEGEPLLVQLRPDSTGLPSDTLLIRAAVLEMAREDSLQRLIAVDAVRIWQRDLAATADSVVYDRVSRGEAQTQEVIRLFRAPMAWFEQTQVSGDTLRIKARSGSVDSLFVRGGAFVAQRDTVLERVRQLRGRDLTGVFEQDSLRTLHAAPNAEVIYFEEDGDGQLKGAVRASADFIVFWFEEGALRQAKWGAGVEGTYYPADLIPEPLQLEGYQWVPERRPTKPSLLHEARVLERLAPYAAAGAGAAVLVSGAAGARTAGNEAENQP